MKNNSVPLSGKSELPVTRRSSLFTPMIDDYLEPTRWFDDFFRRDFFGRDMFPFISNRLGERFNELRSRTPAIDIDETAEAYLVHADIPGVRKEDISVECSENQLTITAERKYETDRNQQRYEGRHERFHGTYQRSFALPIGVDTEKIEATYDGGVLTVNIPKGEKNKARRVEIRGAKGVSHSTDKTGDKKH